MIEPLRAAVRPRVRLEPSGEVGLLEALVADHLAAGETRTLLLCGEVGAGTRLALQHLATVFESESGLQFEELLDASESLTEDPRGLIFIHVEKPQSDWLVKCWLVGWGRDEWIEYLFSALHDRCASVMRRIQAEANASRLDGNPSLWRNVLNELAANEKLLSVKTALWRIIEKMFPDSTERRSFGWRSFVSMAPDISPNRDSTVSTTTTVSVLFEERFRVSKTGRAAATRGGIGQARIGTRRA